MTDWLFVLASSWTSVTLVDREKAENYSIFLALIKAQKYLINF